MNDIKHIIFDFDGTIADSFETSIDIAYELLKNKIPNLTKEKIRDEIKNNNLHQIVKDLNLNIFEEVFFLFKAKKMQNKKMNEIYPFNNIKNILEDIKKKGISIGLLSSNKESNIMKFLNNNNLNIFENYSFNASLKSKKHSILKYIKKHNLNPNQILYIGDEVRDIISCRQAQISCIPVSYGYNSKEFLQSENPQKIVDSPEELIKII